VNDKQALSPEQIQAKLKSLQHSAGQKGAETSDVEITVASQRDAFDLKACQVLLEGNGISSKVVGRGFNQVVVVSRDDSSRSIDVIAAHRQWLLQANPLTDSDYVVGVVAWALGCGLSVPAIGGFFLLSRGLDLIVVVGGVAILMVCSVLLGGALGYLRCRTIASRRRK
jgi:hypothetical protein